MGDLRGSQVGIAKITGAAFVDGQKVLEVKQFTCTSVALGTMDSPLATMDMDGIYDFMMLG